MFAAPRSLLLLYLLLLFNEHYLFLSVWFFLSSNHGHSISVDIYTSPYYLIIIVLTEHFFFYWKQLIIQRERERRKRRII